VADLKILIDLTPQPPAYRPGDKIRGVVTVRNPEGAWEATYLNLMLYWQTSGIGTRDEGVAKTIVLAEKGTQVPAMFTREFELELPLFPWTYFGQLIKIQWQVGVFAKSGWFGSTEFELPIEIRPEGMAGSTGPDDTVIYYDEFGRPTTPPSTV